MSQPPRKYVKMIYQTYVFLSLSSVTDLSKLHDRLHIKNNENFHTSTHKNFKNLWELEVLIVVVVVVVASKKETHEIMEIIKLTDWKACVILFYISTLLCPASAHTNTHTQFEAERVRYKLNKITILWTHLLDKIDYHAVTKFFLWLCFDFLSLGFAACLFWWLGKIPL